MEYKKIEGMAYNLHIVKTNKFKKTMIKINFKNKIDKQSIVNRRLIASILLESNAIYNTKRLLNIKTEDLYNLGLAEDVILSGNVIISSFVSTFLNDKYSEKGMLKDAVRFMCDIIFRPMIKDEKFDTKSFEFAKNSLKEDIASAKEDSKEYAYECVMKIIGNKTPISYSPNGTLEELANVDEHSLYLYYLDMLKKDNVDIFVIGDIDIDEIVNIFKNEFNVKTKKKANQTHYIEHKKVSSKFKIVKEQIDNNQSILMLGYKLKDLTDYEIQYVLPIYSYILGGGPDSKLFKEVREKNSLCYTITSQIKPISNLFLITSGINAKDYNKALKLIKKQIQDMNNGKFEQLDIEKAKMTYLTAYKEINDSIGSIMRDYVNHEYIKTDLTEVKEKEIVKVTKEDILKVVPKIHPSVIFLLEGTKVNEEESIK